MWAGGGDRGGRCAHRPRFPSGRSGTLHDDVSSATPQPRPDTPRGVEAVWRTARARWRFRVRWTDRATGRRRVAEFDSVEEAVAFRDQRDSARVNGVHVELAGGDAALVEFAERRWLPEYVDRELELNTRPSYRSTWRRHLRPRVGYLRLREIDGHVVRALRDDLTRAGHGPPTVRRAMSVLQGICTFAIELGALEHNPVRDIRKPSVTRQLAVVPLSPDQVEALRAELDPYDAALVSVLAYEGLRDFSETFALEERHLLTRTLLVEQRVVQGEIVLGLKNGGRQARSSRNPTLWAPVRQDLDQHLAQLERRGPGRRKLLFPGPDGRPWTYDGDFRLWVRKTLRPALKRAGVEMTRPYDFRHTAASLMFAAGLGAREIAEHLGHSVATLSTYYAHLIADLRGVPPVPVVDQITAARQRRA
jgi:integrase